MRKISLSLKIYLLLIIILAILSALNVFLPQADFLAGQEIAVSKTVHIINIFNINKHNFFFN